MSSREGTSTAASRNRTTDLQRRTPLMQIRQKNPSMQASNQQSILNDLARAPPLTEEQIEQEKQISR